MTSYLIQTIHSDTGLPISKTFYNIDDIKMYCFVLITDKVSSPNSDISSKPLIVSETTASNTDDMLIAKTNLLHDSNK